MLRTYNRKKVKEISLYSCGRYSKFFKFKHRLLVRQKLELKKLQKSDRCKFILLTQLK